MGWGIRVGDGGANSIIPTDDNHVQRMIGMMRNGCRDLRKRMLPHSPTTPSLISLNAAHRGLHHIHAL